MPGTVEVVCGTTHALMYLVNLDTLEVQFLRENHMGAVTQVRTYILHCPLHTNVAPPQSVHEARDSQSSASRIHHR